MHKIYIASGWFNDVQANDLATIESMLDAYAIPYYSPRKECIVNPTASLEARSECYNANILAIDDAEIVFVNTRDKDMGTLFEAGMAAAWGKDIVYIGFGLSGKFNLMLAQSGKRLCTTIAELRNVVEEIKVHGKLTTVGTYKGVIE